jgi:hypothetical protein
MTSRNTPISLSLTLCVALLTACASQPASQPAAAPAKAPASAAASAPASASAPAAATEADTATSKERKFQETARSYKTVERDGKTMYCKREKVLGSTIPTTQCYTETQLRNQVEATEDTKRRMRRGGGACQQTGGCTG